MWPVSLIGKTGAGSGERAAWLSAIRDWLFAVCRFVEPLSVIAPSEASRGSSTGLGATDWVDRFRTGAYDGDTAFGSRPGRTLMTDRYDVSLNTPAGQVTTAIEVPSGFVPITAIMPALRKLGEQALAQEERRVTERGLAISCRKGCAACCRMLVPVSAPEAFALHDRVQALPAERRDALMAKAAQARAKLEQAGLLARLTELAEADRPLTDEDFEPINRAYYALRLPCPFLEDELCTIYDDRPAACRELLVTTPAELCNDLAHNPVKPLPVCVRVSTVLGFLWAELTGGAARLIPLPLALDWAARHQAENRRTWRGAELLDKALDKVWRFLSQEFERRRNANER